MPETWGLLEKSQVDDELIEEAIARLILEHCEDETAHLGTGQSLQSHKASEIIDHVVDSIIEDKIRDFSISFKKFVGDQFMLITAFETIDGWNGTDWDPGGGISVSIFGTDMYTGAVNGYMVKLATEPDAAEPVINFSEDSYYQTSFRLLATTTQTAYALLGERDKGYGFKISNGTLYAYNKYLGVTTTTEITGITLTVYNIYRAVFDGTAREIKFYVNGVLKATHTTNIPSGTTSFVCQYYLETGAAIVRHMTVRELYLFQVK